MNDLNQIKKEIDSIKIEIGVEESLLKKRKSQLKNIRISDIATAQRFLTRTETRIRNLKVKYNSLLEKINKQLEKVSK